MRFSDDWCAMRARSRYQTMAPARDLMLMVIVLAFGMLSVESRKFVRGMFAVASHAGLGQFREIEIHKFQFLVISHVGQHTGIVMKRSILLEKGRRH